ncbi:galactofuranosyltransferase [Xylanibacter muris]|uniref:Galactofuranosyltransferase n=1 Tax=Xylanibacter muris TaxID=2736290 RepID=A0ABX2AJQ2_9BACT|nr:galactofuranosyltransferase [Xylanibacter muris]NPD90945.1 galactofuranosyltransferase [Xylanibacter muris]
MVRLCYITRNYRGVSSAGNKAKTDNEDTLVGMGAVNLGLRRTFYRNKVLTFFIDLAGIIKFVFSVRNDDLVLLQYPVKKYFSFLCMVARFRHARTMTVIHDLGSFRRRKLTVGKEIGRLSNADYVIASNTVMRKWLQSNGLHNTVRPLGLFDYHSPSPVPDNTGCTEDDNRLIYAGALGMRKNAFLLDADKISFGCKIHIYGNRKGLPQLNDSENIIFHDFCPADDFISKVNNGWGLVWDGDSLDCCTGNFGEYLRYNSPHKVSFYLRAGLPVIIWREAALADIIEKQGLGFCIDRLDEIENRLRDITAKEMETIKANVRIVSEKLNEGGFLKDAVAAVMREL